MRGGCRFDDDDVTSSDSYVCDDDDDGSRDHNADEDFLILKSP